MAEAITNEQRRATIDAGLVQLAKRRGRAVADVREIWTERAAIYEYLGGLRHRHHAELYAYRDVFEIMAGR